MAENVRYFYKPPTKYPARIYVLFGNWQERNKRPMGIMKSPLLAIRSSTELEDKEHKDATRMIYYQYESWENLVNDDLNAGVTRKFILSYLEEFKSRRHSIGDEKIESAEVFFERCKTRRIWKGTQLDLFGLESVG